MNVLLKRTDAQPCLQGVQWGVFWSILRGVPRGVFQSVLLSFQRCFQNCPPRSSRGVFWCVLRGVLEVFPEGHFPSFLLLLNTHNSFHLCTRRWADQCMPGHDHKRNVGKSSRKYEISNFEGKFNILTVRNGLTNHICSNVSSRQICCGPECGHHLDL